MIVSKPIVPIAFLHPDVEIVDRDSKARNEARLQDDAQRVGVGRFRRQVGVAAEEAVILVGRVGSDVAVLGPPTRRSERTAPAVAVGGDVP